MNCAFVLSTHSCCQLHLNKNIHTCYRSTTKVRGVSHTLPGNIYTIGIGIDVFSPETDAVGWSSVRQHPDRQSPMRHSVSW